jgi:hypothetical protein
MTTTINRSTQFVNRARNAVSRFHLGGSDYEATMDLLTEHAYRVQRMNAHAAGGNAAQATALDEIYALMEQVQMRAPTFFEPDMGELMEHIGDGNYVTHPATIDY